VSKKEPMQVIAAAFPYQDGAKLALEVLEQAHLDKVLGDKAILSADYHGKITIKETGDMGGGKGAVIGGALGVVLPGIGNIVGAAGGALIGGLAAKLRDAGFPNDQLKTLGDKLTPNTSLLLAVVESQHVDEVAAKLRSLNASVITEGLTQEAVDQLSASDFATNTAARSAVVAAMTAEAAPNPAEPVQAAPAAGQGFAPLGEDSAR
jgi:uncharacterized membrane protein